MLHSPTPCTAAAVNDAPVLANRAYSVFEGSILVVSSADGLLAGATDVEGDHLAVVNSTKPRNGNVTVQGDGSFVYAPRSYFNGLESFNYTVGDGQGGFTLGTAVINVGEWASLERGVDLQGG